MSMFDSLRLLLLYIVGLFWSFGVFLQILRLLVTKPRKLLYSKNRKTPPSCLQDPDLGTHGYAHVNGLRLHYVASGSSQKPLMLLLHGFPEFWYSWRWQIRAFNKDYRVVAVDLRGYGDSDKPSSVEEYKIEKMVEDIKQLIPALGYECCVLVGHDWGGAISWGLSTLHPQLVSKVIILNCPHPQAMSDFVHSNWKQFLKSWYMFFVNLPWLPEWFFFSGDRKMLENAFRSKTMGAKAGSFSDADIEAFKYTYNKRSDFTGPMNYIRASLRYGTMTKTFKRPIGGVPILLIWGTRDGALSQDMAELSRGYASNFRLKCIEGASHWVQQEETEVVNKYMEEFLTSDSLSE